MDRLKAGTIIAVARTVTVPSYAPQPMKEIPTQRWQGWEPDEYFWNVGDTTFQVSSDSTGYNRTSVICLDIRIDPDKMILAPIPESPADDLVPMAVQRPGGSGGRPRKEYWEDVIVAAFDGLFHGTLTPTTQADIERFMLDWISAKHADTPSEASVRTRAAKVWKVHKKEG
jgi:hypothetical protein